MLLKTENQLSGEIRHRIRRRHSTNADGSYNLDLEPAAGTGDTEGHLYKLIEKQSPEGYLLDETPIYFF